MREIKFRYTFQHNETGRIASVIKNLDDEGPYLDHPSNKWTLLGRDQYTGAKDKNNKEIYEEDIVRFTWLIDKTYVVKWNNESHEWQLHNREMSKYIEIIGTIHENPGLLEETSDG